MEWSKVKSSQLKLMAAGIGAGALVAMGTLTVVFSDAPGGTLGDGPEITLGETTTSTTAPAPQATKTCRPILGSERPNGFAAGG